MHLWIKPIVYNFLLWRCTYRAVDLSSRSHSTDSILLILFHGIHPADSVFQIISNRLRRLDFVLQILAYRFHPADSLQEILCWRFLLKISFLWISSHKSVSSSAWQYPSHRICLGRVRPTDSGRCLVFSVVEPKLFFFRSGSDFRKVSAPATTLEPVFRIRIRLCGSGSYLKTKCGFGSGSRIRIVPWQNRIGICKDTCIKI